MLLALSSSNELFCVFHGEFTNLTPSYSNIGIIFSKSRASLRVVLNQGHHVTCKVQYAENGE